MFYEYEKSFPRKDKYCLGQKCENLILEILELIVSAIQAYKATKLKFLDTASNKLNTLKFIIRLSKDVKALDSKKYEILQEKLNEIGRMLGGWIKSLK